MDFAGHPELLELELSSRKSWGEWFDGLFESDEEKENEDEDEEESDLDDDLYVIEWGQNSWRLGLAQGTLEHLEKLYIDQDGKIHRVEKVDPSEEDQTSETGESVEGLRGPEAIERTVWSGARRYSATRARFEKE